MENNINIFSLNSINGYSFSIYFTEGELWCYGGNIFIIEIKDVIGNIIFKCNIHYDYLMHILFNSLTELYEYGNPFEENLPITSTTCTNSIMGYTNEKDNIVLAFTEYNIITHRVNKYIELEFEIDVIHEILSSGELFELLESMSE